MDEALRLAFGVIRGGTGEIVLCKGARHFKTRAAEFVAVRFGEQIFFREVREQRVEEPGV